jgi:hypothetical protein
VTKPIVFGDVSYPEEWAFGDKLAYLVVTDKNWTTYYSNPPQGSDFATCIYMVASLGVRPNPGYRIRILQIKQQNERITVSVELMEPDPKKVYPQVIVRPIAVAEVPKGNLQPYYPLHFVFSNPNQPIRLPGLKPGVCSGLILSGAFYPDLKIGVWRRRTYQVI